MSTCARRPSSLSITARIWRYSGSGALMMSELVVGSAWMMPPVDGWLASLLPLLPWPVPRPELPRPPALPLALVLLPRPLVWPRPDAPVRVRPPDRLPVPVPPPLLVPLPPALPSAARRVVASFTASAFFRYTTWMLPLAAELPGAAGWSSLATNERTSATRAGLAARTISALLRGSASSVVLNELSVCPWATPCAVPVAVALPPSIRRDTSGARSVAMACCSGITSTSLALETSMAATMRARRCRLSA